MVPVEAQSSRCVFAPAAARGCQRGPAEQRLVAVIGELRVGDRHLAAEPVRRPLVVELVQPLVDGRVDAADEDAGDAGDLGDVAARARQVLEPGDIGFDDLLIDAHGEQQRDVDVQPAPISWRIAGMPAGVAGTFTIRLGRSTAAHSRSASATVASVSLAR